MASKKKGSKITKAPSKSRKASPQRSISLDKNELRIKYSDSHDLLDKLLGATRSISRLHSHQLLSAKPNSTIASNVLTQFSSADAAPDLGPSAAFDIVTTCANRTDLNLQIGEIPGLEPTNFQKCVQDGVEGAKYVPVDFPASSSTTLWAVVQAIQASPPQ